MEIIPNITISNESFSFKTPRVGSLISVKGAFCGLTSSWDVAASCINSMSVPLTDCHCHRQGAFEELVSI